MKVKLYLFLGLFFTVTPVLAIDPITAIGMGVSFISSIFGGAAARRQRRQAERLRRRQENQVKALEANRQDIPDFGQDLENPFANLQIATRAAEMQAEQQDISLASTLDVLRSTGASAGGATALARAASQSKRGVSAQIEQQEARNAQLRAQGELQAAQIRQRGQMAEFQATERREMQQLNRASSLASSASQQAAAYGAQANAMFGQAIGTLGSFAAAGGFGKSGPFAQSQQPPRNFSESGLQGSGAGVDLTSGDFSTNFNQQFGNQDLYGNFISNRAQEYINTAPNFGNIGGPQTQEISNFLNTIPTNPYAGLGISDQLYNTLGSIQFPR